MTETLRLQSHPVLGETPSNLSRVTVIVDGISLELTLGENLAAGLWANGIRALRRDASTDTPRGLYCATGHCYECRVTVDGMQDVRACLVTVRDAMTVVLQAHPSSSEGASR